MGDTKRGSNGGQFIRVAIGLAAAALLLTVYQNCAPQLPEESADDLASTKKKDYCVVNCTPDTSGFGVTVNPLPTPTPAPAGSKTVIGYIDAVTVNDSGAIVTGWACLSTLKTSIDVHLYKNAPAGSAGSEFVTSVKANLSSEAGVAQTCNVTEGSFRFSIPLTQDMLLNSAGQKLYAYGISIVLGVPNAALGGSGTMVILPPKARPIYRFWSKVVPGHIFTHDPNELADTTKFTAEGAPFSLIIATGANLVPLYRCYVSSTSQHFLSLDANCERQSKVGPLGLVSSVQVPGSSRPLYRCVHPTTGDHMTVVDNVDECNQAGYTVEGSQGFVR